MPLVFHRPPGGPRVRVFRAVSIPATILVCAVFLASPGDAGAGEDSRDSDLGSYRARLKDLVSAFGRGQLELAKWCRVQGLEERAREARERSEATGVGGEARGSPVKREADPEKAYAGKVRVLRGDVSRGYAGLGAWCLERKLLYESRRSVEASLRWDARNLEARRLARKPALKGDFLRRIGREDEPGVWKAGRWVPEAEFRKHAEKRVEILLEKHTKTFGLPFEGDFLPCVDVFHTLPGEAFAPIREAVRRFLGLIRGRFFLTDPKRPLRFFCLRDAAEFKAMGKNPWMGGAYEWGKGEIYTFPGVSVVPGLGATGTVLHEFTHAFLEASFLNFPPLWMNEGLACFFETHGDLGGEHPFGYVNARDAWYARALKEGKARTLPRLVKECALSIDPLGYAQGRTLMNFLWSRGQLTAFVVGAQLYEKDLTFDAILCRVLEKSLEEIGKDVEAFARSLPAALGRIERGTRADEAIDECLWGFISGD